MPPDNIYDSLIYTICRVQSDLQGGMKKEKRSVGTTYWLVKKEREICPACHGLSDPEEPFFNPPITLMAHGR